MAQPGPRILKSHEDIIVAQYRKLRSTRAVAERTGFSRSKVQRYLRRAGVEMRPTGRPKKDRASGTGSL